MDDLAIDSSRQRTNLSGKDSSVSLPTMRSHTQVLVLLTCAVFVLHLALIKHF